MPGPTAPGMAPASARERAIAVLAGLVLTLVLTYPTIRDVGRVGRFDSGDGRFSVWNVAWVAHALLADPRHVLDANIFYPHRGTLAYSELNLAAGAAAVPVYAVTRNPVAAHNSAVLLALFASFVAMWALVRVLTESAGAGLAAAAGYTFSAYTAAHTAEIQLLMVFAFPLVMFAFHRLANRPTIGAGILLGAALAISALASGYYGVFAGGMAAVATLWWARRDRSYWVAIGIAAGAAALLVAPALIPYARAQAAAGALRTKTPDEARLYSAGWADYAASGTVAGTVESGLLATVKRAALPGLALQRHKEVLFPGMILCVLAAIGAASARRANRRVVFGYLAIGGLALWASFGPDAGLYTLMLRALPGAGFLRAPVRLGIVVIFAAATLAGFGVAAVSRRRAWIGTACLAALVLEAWVPWPLQPMPSPERAYVMLATLPPGGVVEFPFPYTPIDFHSHTKAMMRSMVNWQPLVNGYSDFVPSDFTQLAVPINGFPDPASFEILRAHQVRYVIVRMAEYGQGEYRQRLLDRFPPYSRYLRRLTDDQDVWLFEILAFPDATTAQSAGGAG